MRMEIGQIAFDENMELSLTLADINSTVCLVLSDGLKACEEELTAGYQRRTIDFLEHCTLWYGAAVRAVMERGERMTGAKVTQRDVKLMNIFILFEQDESPLFGLSFRTEFDIEHGCGLKIRGDTYDVVEIGSADVAFC